MQSAVAFLQNTKREMLEHPFLRCRFVENMSTANPLTIAQAKIFARLYYPHILRTRLYQACAMGITPDERIQAVFADILYDEYGNGEPTDSHMQLYRNFMIAVQETPATNPDKDIIPALQHYIDANYELVHRGPWIAAVGAVGIASEWPIPAFYQKLLTGLQTIPNVSLEALELFSGHIELDLEHSRMMEEALLPHLDDVRQREEFLFGINQNLDARLQFLEALNALVFG